LLPVGATFLVIVTLKLAASNISFRGNNEHSEEKNEINFIAVIQLLTKRDHVLQEL
jgi:hypothetical protein